ncbi:hypothetical protein HPB51_015379 [Rhipicephalus microplus]|uniref:Uncharacterized protein n=1 Tax=Rhipicephalus microplus TaxID=6941 RepID=A0A9J6DVL2_RHIMP|nr:hypothetical protein HPB51_015379 [Rhipicephalus microplus]
MSPTSREAPELKKGSAVSSPSEDLNAMIQTVRKRTGESNTEFESGMPLDSCDEDSTQSRVQLRSAKPSKQQQASMLDMNDNSDCDLWLYKDHLGCVHGPFSGACMFSWTRRWPHCHPTLENEEPPLNCNGKFFKGGQTSFIDSQEKPVESIKVVNPTVETAPAVLPGTRVHRAEHVKAELGFRDNAELLAEDNHTNGSLKEEVEAARRSLGRLREVPNSTQLRIGGSDTTSRKKEHGLPPYIYRCSRHSCCSNNLGRSVPESADKAANAGTYGRTQVGTPEPVAIENMTRFPSLGGKAFARALQSKSRNQQQDPAWTRRAAADQDFTRWCYDRLGRLPSYVHVPTFFELLREVDSNSEIEEYVRQHFGSGEEASRFAHEFVQRRLQWKQLTG